MHILIIAQSAPWVKGDNDGLFELDQAIALAELGYKVTVAALDIRSIKMWRKWGVSRKRIKNVEYVIVSIPCGPLPIKFQKFFGQLCFGIAYKKILVLFGKPEIIHGHFVVRSSFYLKYAKKINIPFIVTEHSSNTITTMNLENEYTRLALKVYQAADLVISVSPYLANLIKKKYNIDSICVPNIIDVEIFQYKQKDCTKMYYEFVFVGNLVFGKRSDLLVNAFINVFQNNNKVFLTIIGDGVERKKLERIIKCKNMAKQIFLKGYCERKEIAQVLQKCDCFVLPSQFETFGVSYIEALATGTPVIATKCGGPESFIHEKNGILIPVDNILCLEEALKKMYLREFVYDNYAISKEIVDKYNSNAVAKQLGKLYRKTIDQNQSQHEKNCDA